MGIQLAVHAVCLYLPGHRTYRPYGSATRLGIDGVPPAPNHYLLLMIAIAIWAIGDGFGQLTADLDLKILIAKFTYLGIVATPVLYFVAMAAISQLDDSLDWARPGVVGHCADVCAVSRFHQRETWVDLDENRIDRVAIRRSWPAISMVLDSGFFSSTAMS